MEANTDHVREMASRITTESKINSDDLKEAIEKISVGSGIKIEDYPENIRIDDLIELQEYRKLGRLEDVKKAIDKQKPINPDITEIESGTKYLKCPKCKLTTVIYNEMVVGYCPKCGQRLG